MSKTWIVAAMLLTGCATGPAPVAVRMTDAQIAAMGPAVDEPAKPPMTAAERAKVIAESDAQLAASNAAWKQTQSEWGNQSRARIQCEYEVASNPMILQGGWLMQAATQNHLMGMCLRAKGL